MADDAPETGIWSMVELYIATVGACLPCPTPHFRAVKQRYARKKSGTSQGTGGNHTRPQEGRTGALEQPWRQELDASAAPTHVPSDKNGPLTSHREWADKASSNDLTSSSMPDLEMPKTFHPH
jgi:hypothetical protein